MRCVYILVTLSSLVSLARFPDLCCARSPAAVAVAVIRDGARPQLQENPDEEGIMAVPSEFLDLMKTCWHQDPTIRPSFLVRACLNTHTRTAHSLN